MILSFQGLLTLRVMLTILLTVSNITANLRFQCHMTLKFALFRFISLTVSEITVNYNKFKNLVYKWLAAPDYEYEYFSVEINLNTKNIIQQINLHTKYKISKNLHHRK